MDPFQNRRWVIILIMLGVGLIFMFRLLFIQVINKDWSDRAAQISSTIKNIQPPRGFIYDRNHRLLYLLKNLDLKLKKRAQAITSLTKPQFFTKR